LSIAERQHGVVTRRCGALTDFYWQAIGLVVETDGLRYHRTPAQQTRDRLRRSGAGGSRPDDGLAAKPQG
jgi:hypothetical protein